jgi:hypothetical protein
LPIIEATADTRQWQAAEAVARRCLILAGVQAVALGREAQRVIAWLQREGLWPDVSRDEQSFLSQPSVDRALQNALTWRAEALWTLWWALGIAEKLSWPPGECDLGDVLDRPSGPQVPWIGDDTPAFVTSCVLRAAAEILDETDLIYRVHWAVREAALRRRLVPAGVDPDVVVERHYALNWLIRRYGVNDWDDVDTST